MDRSYLARENKDNEVLKVKEDSAYYNFLRQMPLNDSIIVADKNFSSFINRLEYMDFARAVGDTTTVEMGKIAYKYPEKSVLTYLKKNGVVLTPEQEKMRKDSEDRAGKTVTREISELIAETKIWEELSEKYKDLFEAYRKENEVKNDVSVSIDENQKAEDEKIMRINQFFENQREKSGRLDTIVGYVPLVSQIIALRSLPFDLKQLDREGARSLLDKEKQLINHPFMLAEAERCMPKLSRYKMIARMLCLKGLLLKSYVISLKPMQVKLCLSISGQRFVVPVVVALNTLPVYANSIKITRIFSSYISPVIVKVPKRLIMNM